MLCLLVILLQLCIASTALYCSSGPQSPRSVMSFCSVIVWQAPFRVYESITGYELRLFNSNVAEDATDGDLVGSVVISKKRDELFHAMSASDMPKGNSSVLVQVRALWETYLQSPVAITCPAWLFSAKPWKKNYCLRKWLAITCQLWQKFNGFFSL